MTALGFDQVVEHSHRAWGDFVKGDPEPAKTLFSHQEDVTLGNPFGPFVRGWEQVEATMERAASQYRDGQVSGFETIAAYAGTELGYIIEVERYRARVGASPDITPVALRVTSILRREDGVWKILHRHADPIITARPAESVINEYSNG